ncbi:hypothetical protein [Bradyrhizobium diazoefficiens]|uniref:Uncharacterized protein n=1 Tax=Bradyrhizobium diazoefficiens TaxID=1355477 RepID=A0A810BJA7_9BRAD|nr:hypothetical protein XF8B_58040 [Bradyrhizobium diazoefficiens]
MDGGQLIQDVDSVLQIFKLELEPVEKDNALLVLTDNRTGAHYCECHVRAEKLVSLGTTDVPLDPNHPDYRANRELTDDDAFDAMRRDALERRSFSNIVAEYIPSEGEERPLKIIGGQHRFTAIKQALQSGINELHGLKVYFGLDMNQRLDVQLISNTNITVSGALTDRLKETFRGPNLREWCQTVGLLKEGQDFGDTKTRGGPFTVDLARTFIENFYSGQKIKLKGFANTETTPYLYKSGQDDSRWQKFLDDHPDIWKDKKLKAAGEQFARLVAAQRNAFAKKKGVADFSEKALNGAVLSAWAFAAGVFQGHPQRLKRHYAIADHTGHDPLNVAVLAKGRHKTDKDNYRGLGYRTDARERAQMVELFEIISGSGDKINAKSVNAAIYARFAKQALLDAKRTRGG